MKVMMKVYNIIEKKKKPTTAEKKLKHGGMGRFGTVSGKTYLTHGVHKHALDRPVTDMK